MNTKWSLDNLVDFMEGMDLDTLTTQKSYGEDFTVYLTIEKNDTDEELLSE